MFDLPGRAEKLRSLGRRTAYARGYSTDATPENATHLHICLGPQWSGTFLYLIDLDTFVPARNSRPAKHTPGQNADAAKAAFVAERPELAAKLDWHRSQSGAGWHALFESHKKLDTGKLYDADGNHIGELLGEDTDRILDPGDVQATCLHIGEIERLLNVWHVKSSDPKGERWTDREKQGAAWTHGARYIPVKLQQLRTFLQNDAGPVGKQLDTFFDQRQPFNRSDKAGSLMQTLMLYAHKLHGCANAPFTVRCANVKAYWMAADSFGKAGDKGYNQDKDGDSLIAQIVNGDSYGDGRRWIVPFWAKSQATSAPAPLPTPETPRPAHRPAGDRNKHLVTFRRVLEAIEPDDFGRRTYTLAYLADRMKIARCACAPRTIQGYLKTLRDAEEIVTAQIGGNGTPYAVLTRCFGDAIKSEKRVEIVPESPVSGGADPTAKQSVLTPQNIESTPICIEDHQNTGAPLALPTAPPAPDIDEWAGIDAELEAWEQTTADGRHFAKLRRRWESTAESIMQLSGILRPAHRDLVSQVRNMARVVDEPGWWQRDYTALDVNALAVELRRLKALAGAPVGAQAFGDLPNRPQAAPYPLHT